MVVDKHTFNVVWFDIAVCVLKLPCNSHGKAQLVLAYSMVLTAGTIILFNKNRLVFFSAVFRLCRCQ